jgi:hypothetical protein
MKAIREAFGRGSKPGHKSKETKEGSALNVGDMSPKICGPSLGASPPVHPPTTSLRSPNDDSSKVANTLPILVSSAPIQTEPSVIDDERTKTDNDASKSYHQAALKGSRQFYS